MIKKYLKYYISIQQLVEIERKEIETLWKTFYKFKVGFVQYGIPNHWSNEGESCHGMSWNIGKISVIRYGTDRQIYKSYTYQ